MSNFKVVRLFKTLGHAAALVFAAFWLVATSAQTGPAKECFTGISNPTTLQVVLGTPPSGDGGAQPGEPSCQGIDGLAPGGTLVFALSQGPRPQGLDACWAYQTQSIQGATDVTLDTPQLGDAVAGLTLARGQFTSSTAQGCRGEWELTLTPNLIPAPGTMISPLDAGPSQEWHVERSIYLEQAQFCNGLFTASGQLGCEDFFPVTGITQVSP